MNRKDTLESALKAVTLDRAVKHGKPEDSFKAIAEFWTTYLRTAGVITTQSIKPDQVATMMGLLKIARAAQNHTHDDNYIDMAGYAACAAEIATAGRITPDQMQELHDADRPWNVVKK